MDQLDTPIDVPTLPAPQNAAPQNAAAQSAAAQSAAAQSAAAQSAAAQNAASQNGFTVGATAILAERRLHTLKYGDLFGVFDQNGNILSGPGIADGLYYLDTRHLSSLALSICGQAPILLSATLRENNATLSCDLTNPDLELDGHKLCHDLLHLRRTLFLRDQTAHERLQIRNYDVVAHTVVIELAFQADFADLFEARGTPRGRPRPQRAPGGARGPGGRGGPMGRLGPGQMIAVDLVEGVVLEDRAVKDRIAGEQDYAAMIGEFLTEDDLPAPQGDAVVRFSRAELARRQVELILSPMVEGARRRSARWATTRRSRSSPTSRASSASSSARTSAR